MNDSTRPLDLTPAELSALQQYVSPDTTREALSTLWSYSDATGVTHVASDGHTIVRRSAGSHVGKTLAAIVKACVAVSADKPHATPFSWESVLKAPKVDGKNAPVRGINPAYFARVAKVEAAAGKRAADDYVPPPGTSKKTAAQVRANLRTGSCSTWAVPVDALDGWYWSIKGDVLWEGVIMPRRV